MKSTRNAKIIFSILFVFFSVSAFSQQFIIQGVVQDSINKQAISYVAVYIKDANNVVVSIAYSDDNGKFKLPFSGITSGTLNAELIGYKKYSKNLTFTAGSEYYEEIFLSPDIKMLGEVEISDSANKVVHKIDRDIHKITEQEIKISQNIYDILKTLPGVVVDENTNSIRFKGSAPEILVNNMPADMLFSDLRAINIKNIEKIELIDKSSIYGGSGEGGIINIKLKKEKEKSFGMYLGGDFRYGIKDNIFVPDWSVFNLNFHIGKIIVFNNLRIDTWANKENTMQNQNIFVNNTYYDKEIEKSELFRQWQILNALGIVIPIGKVQILLADQVGYSKIKSNHELSEKTFQGDTNISLLEENSYDNYKFLNNNTIIQLTGNDLKNQDFQILFNFYKSFPLTDVLAFFNQKHTNFFDNTQENNNYNLKINNNSLLYKYDGYYIYHISQTSQVNIHSMFLDNELPNNTLKYFINGIEESNYRQVSDAKIQELISGLSYGKRFEKFSTDFTLNYHFQRIAGTFLRNNFEDTINLNLKYHLFEPSVRLKYFVNNENNFYIGYIYKNDNFSLNNSNYLVQKYIPYIDKVDPYKWGTGNKNLKQERYHYLYFQYQLNKENFYFNSEIFYKQTHNMIEDINIPITNEITLSMPENIAFYNRIGTDLSFRWKINDNWSINFWGQAYHSKFRINDLNLISELYQISQKEIIRKGLGMNFQSVIYYTFNVKKSWTPSLLFWADYNSKEITFTGYNHQYINTNIAFKTKLYKDKLSFVLALENFLSPFIHKQSYYDYLDVVSRNNYYSYHNNIRLRLSLDWYLFAGDRGTKDFKL